MSTTYTAKVAVNCQKEHTCAGCGSVYSYPLVRTVEGSSTTSEQAAREQAEANAAAATKKEIELHPCPTCGLYQPDMVAKQRKARHLTILLLGTILAMITLLGASADFARALSFTALQSNTATIVMVLITAAVFVSYMLVELQALNRHQPPNKRLNFESDCGCKRH